MIAQTLTQMEEIQHRMRHLVQEQSYEDALALGDALMDKAAALFNATDAPQDTDRLRLEHLFKQHIEMATQLEGDLQLERTAVRNRRKAIGAYAKY